MRTRLAAPLAFCAVSMAVTGAEAAPMHFTYVASALGGNATVDRGAPAGTAPLGQMRFTPRRRVFTVRIDDATVLDGQTIRVWLYNEDSFVERCLPVRKTVRLSTRSVGREMMLVVLGDSERLERKGLRGPDAECTGHATGGTADIGL